MTRDSLAAALATFGEAIHSESEKYEEELVPAIRRVWRFGQERHVWVYLIASELEGAVVKNLQAKERKYEAMADAMAGHMRELTRNAVRGGRLVTTKYEPKQNMRLPTWLR